MSIEVTNILRRARIAMRASDPDTAFALASEALGLDPESTAAYDIVEATYRMRRLHMRQAKRDGRAADARQIAEALILMNQFVDEARDVAIWATEAGKPENSVRTWWKISAHTDEKRDWQVMADAYREVSAMDSTIVDAGFALLKQFPGEPSLVAKLEQAIEATATVDT